MSDLDKPPRKEINYVWLGGLMPAELDSLEQIAA